MEVKTYLDNTGTERNDEIRLIHVNLCRFTFYLGG